MNPADPKRGTRGPIAIAAARNIVVLMHDFYEGGVERIAITLANAWHALGRDVTILCGCEEGRFRARVAPGVHVATVEPLIPQGRLSRIRLGFASVRALRTLRPDVVFAPGNFHLPVIGIAARARYAHRPAFVCKLSNRLHRPTRSRLRQAVFSATTRIWAARLDGIAAMSPALREEARTLLRDCHVESMWEPCITWDTLVSLPRGEEPPIPRILVVGRLVPEKNVSLALQAFAVFRRRRQATLQIVGDGPLRPRLEQECRTLGIADDVQFTGHVDDTRRYFASASVLLSTSRYEGYPAVIVEALAAGIPVVATDSSPALPEMLSDPTFGIAARAAPDALADALGSALSCRPAAAALDDLIARHRSGHSAQAYLDWLDWLCAEKGRPVHPAGLAALPAMAAARSTH